MKTSLIIWKKKSFSKLTVGLSSSGGRVSSGQISIHHRGGGRTRLLRVIDFSRFVWNTPGIVFRTEYNPFSRSLVSFVVYCNGVFCYVLTPNGLVVGNTVRGVSFVDPGTVGECSYLSSFSTGTFVHNIELHGQTGGQLLRAMGSYGRIMSKTASSVVVRLRSGKLQVLSAFLVASFGTLDSFLFAKKMHNKAGFFRLRGFRPTVRGVAMNPIDHPHGGGEGKSAAGRPSVSRWGWLTKNVKAKKA